MPFNAAQLTRAYDAIERAIERGETPGAVLAVGQRTGLTAIKAFGFANRVGEIRPMTEETIFDMASVTKPMATATSIMILIEEGRLRLDDPVARFFPEFVGEGKDAIRIRHLLTHTSGIPAWASTYIACRGPEEVIPYICQLPLDYPTGSKVVYSCLGFILLGELVRRLTGQCLDQFAHERIFAPLGMAHTCFNPPALWKNSIAATEIGNGFEQGMVGPEAAAAFTGWRTHLLIGEVHDGNAWGMGGVSGNAGLFSSAYDVARFATAYLNEGLLDGFRLLSSRTVRTMTTNFTTGLNEHRGLGWSMKDREYSSAGDLFSERAYGHTGFTGTTLWIDPELDLFVALLTNRVHPDCKGNVVRLRPLVHNSIAAA
ncbi:MAG: serine hydrolase domain-containing protein, partial [Bacillota bacterium]